MRKSFIRALHISLYDDRHRFGCALAHLLKCVFEFYSTLLGQLHVAEFTLPEQGNFARFAFVIQHHHVATGSRYVGEPLHFHGNGCPRFQYRFAVFIQHGADSPKHCTREQHVALSQCTRLHQNRCHRTTAFIETRFNHDTFGGCILDCFQFEYFGLQQNRVEQIIDALPRLGRHRNKHYVSTVFFRQHVFRHQLLLDAIRIGLRLVDLVHRHNDRHICRLRVRNRFFGLRHHAVIGCDNENDNVGDLGAARAHRRERLVTWRIEESNHALGRGHVIRANMLGYATGFTGSYAGATDGIEQRSLAVINVAHDRHHRWTWLHVRLGMDNCDLKI